MLIKKSIIQKQSKFNFELEKAFSNDTLFIQGHDISRSILPMNMLSEYIRYCYYDNYICYNEKKMSKYIRLLLKYDHCNQSVLVKECKKLCRSILTQAMKMPCSLKSMDLSFAMNESNDEDICELSNDLLTMAMGRHVRALNQ